MNILQPLLEKPKEEPEKLEGLSALFQSQKQSEKEEPRTKLDKPMKILITGGGGFVASHLIEHCLDQGDEVCVTVRWYEDLHRLSKFQDKVKLIYSDVDDLSSLIRAFADNKPDVISHLAAQSWVPFSYNNPINTIGINAMGTLNVLEAVRLVKDYIHKDWDPFIHICSSSEYYGKVKRKDLPITENHPPNPGNPYGVGKACADIIAQYYLRDGMRIAITRMFTHCGVGRTMMSAENFYAREVALRELDGKDTISISNKAGMDSLRTWADVRDAVVNYRNLFESGKTGVFNISGETVKSLREVLDYLVSISNIPNKEKLKFVEDPRFFRNIDVDKQVVDISKFKNEVKWSKKISFEQLMSDLLDFWRKRVKEDPFIAEIQ